MRKNRPGDHFTKGRCYPNRAFSLIEVVLALGICAFCLITMLGLLLGAGFSARHSVEYSQATDVASRIRAEIYAALDSTPGATVVKVSGNSLDLSSTTASSIEFIVNEIGREVEESQGRYRVSVTPLQREKLMVDGEGNVYRSFRMMIEVMELSKRKFFKRPLVRTYVSYSDREQSP